MEPAFGAKNSAVFGAWIHGPLADGGDVECRLVASCEHFHARPSDHQSVVCAQTWWWEDCFDVRVATSVQHRSQEMTEVAV